MSSKGEANGFVRGANEFVRCLRDSECMLKGMHVEFHSTQEAATTINEVVKVLPDSWAAFRVQYRRGLFGVTLGGPDASGDMLSDPRGWGAKPVYNQLCEMIGMHYERQRVL